ncbi:MAG: adenylate/guanylate cyclase domain-containing protein [Bacteroidia bacterium]|nr:adenylate/guanylate cyclase domain-containing protein [Bacteroidia bacterium]
MEEIRKLSTILFADIAGYTAMMQKDERHALGILNQFKEILETYVPQHKGIIVQYFGDGCLLSFESATDGVTCASALQSSLVHQQIPVRIGMHLGEVIFKNNNVFGDGVNIASRIETMGVAGSIIISKAIRDQIKNNSAFQLSSLGAFQFKNVDTPMQIFALANEGLTVPKRQEMKGKLKEEEGSLFQQLWKKRIPQILAVYILLAWLGVQLFDWALHQFGISPHWAQIFFISILGLIPSLLVYLNNQERVSKGQLKLGEKILFPSNLILVGAVLFFIFRTTDLGATSKDITFTDLDGGVVTKTIIKEEFKKRFPIFSFEPMKKDSVNEWIGNALGVYINFKLRQNEYLSPYFIQQPLDKIHAHLTKVEKVQRAKTATESFYIDGQYQVIDDQYEVISALRNRKSGNLIKERRFISNDLLTLMDSVGRFMIQSVGLSPSQIEANPDLSVREMATDKVEALKHFIISLTGLGDLYINLEKAIELDSTFALALQGYAAKNYYYQRGSLETKRAINQAMRHRKRLPYAYQIALRVQKHLIYREWEKAEELLKIQLEIEPNNDLYNNSLLNVYFKTGQYDKQVEHSEDRFARDPTPTNGLQSIRALMVNGQADKVIGRVKNYLLLDPQNVSALELLTQAYILSGDLDKAKKTCEKIILINPELEPYISKNLEALDYMETHPINQEDLSKFVGVFRSIYSEQIIENRLLNGLLYSKAFHQNGIYLYPAGENQLKSGKIYGGREMGLLINSEGKVYGFKNTETEKIKSTSYYYYWKQDSTIWQAEDLLRKGDYEKAQIAYQKAIDQHPEHYYLQQAKQHLDYVQSQSKAELLENFQRLVGQYGEIDVWIENGLLYYKKLGISRRIFRPLSRNRFTTLLNYAHNYEIIEKGGQVVAIQGSHYNLEKREWEKSPNWYFERTEKLD